MEAQINGKKIYYDVYGEGQPLILIHGLGVTHQMWKWQIEELKKDFKIIVYDIPGHGQSENKFEDNVYRGLADDLVGLMDHLDIEKAALCGLSLGGRVALATAVHHPDRVSKLMVSSTFEQVKGLLERFQTWLGTKIIKSKSLKEIIDMSADNFFPDSKDEEARELYKKEGMKVEKAAIDRLSEAANQVSYGEDIKKIDVPTLVFAGGHEKNMAKKISKRIADAIPKAKVEIIPDVGHVWNMQKPQLFNQKVREFIK
mgnify:CR=1 FL=1